MSHYTLSFFAGLVGFGCTSAKESIDSEEIPLDVQHIDLALNLNTYQGTEILTFTTSASTLHLQTEGLTILSVQQDGQALEFTQDSSWLDISDIATAAPIQIEYQFEPWSVYDFVGWMPDQGVSFTWPYHCDYLFPCHSDVADGVTFSVSIVGDNDKTLIYPTEITSESPAYMFGFAQGIYEELAVGETTHGTQISMWYFPQQNGIDDAISGSSHLVASVQYLEDQIGPYAFGSKMASVEVDWGEDSYGGMEHHPYFHVGQYDFWNEEAQVHEATHGWFGNGVRLECWEDFVLSEGTTTYLTAKALEANSDYDLWAYYVDEFLIPICEGGDVNAIVHPEGCGELDFENSDVWSLASYMKGACFYKEVESVIGSERILADISAFYQDHLNQAATVEDMMEYLLQDASADERIQIENFHTLWLNTLACPSDYVDRCR